MKNIQMVDLVSQYIKISDQINGVIQSVIDSSRFIGGPEVTQFATGLADYLECNHAIPCGNGTDALQLALMALELEPNDEVITTPFTFVSTIEVIALLGLRPVFVDIDPDTFNIDASKIEAAITDRTRVILPVHLFGQPSDMQSIVSIARKHNLKIIEDNAQSIGATVDIDGQTKYAGTIGDIGTLSFFPSKNLGCFGDGGAVLTQDAALADKITLFAKHGSHKKYYYQKVGINSRLDAMQAAILNVKLEKLDNYNNARQEAARYYDRRLANVDVVTTPKLANGATHVYHQYTLRVKEGRDDLQAHLKANGVPSMIYYPMCLHIQEAYADLGYRLGDFPVAEQASKEVLSLPMHTELSPAVLEYIVSTLTQFYK